MTPRGVTLPKLLVALLVGALLVSVVVPAGALLQTRAAHTDLLRSVAMLERELEAVHRATGGLPPAWSCTPAPPSNAPAGAMMDLHWSSEPWRTLARRGSAPIGRSPFRFCLHTGRLETGAAFAALWTFHDLDDDGVHSARLSWFVEDESGELRRAHEDTDPAPYE